MRFFPQAAVFDPETKVQFWSGAGTILEEIASYEARDKNRPKPWLINNMNLYSMWIALAKILNLLEKTK